MLLWPWIRWNDELSGSLERAFLCESYLRQDINVNMYLFGDKLSVQFLSAFRYIPNV